MSVIGEIPFEDFTTQLNTRIRPIAEETTFDPDNDLGGDSSYFEFEFSFREKSEIRVEIFEGEDSSTVIFGESGFGDYAVRIVLDRVEPVSSADNVDHVYNLARVYIFGPSSGVTRVRVSRTTPIKQDEEFRVGADLSTPTRRAVDRLTRIAQEKQQQDLARDKLIRDIENTQDDHDVSIVTNRSENTRQDNEITTLDARLQTAEMELDNITEGFRLVIAVKHDVTLANKPTPTGNVATHSPAFPNISFTQLDFENDIISGLATPTDPDTIADGGVPDNFSSGWMNDNHESLAKYEERKDEFDLWSIRIVGKENNSGFAPQVRPMIAVKFDRDVQVIEATGAPSNRTFQKWVTESQANAKSGDPDFIDLSVYGFRFDPSDSDGIINSADTTKVNPLSDGWVNKLAEPPADKSLNRLVEFSMGIEADGFNPAVTYEMRPLEDAVRVVSGRTIDEWRQQFVGDPYNFVRHFPITNVRPIVTDVNLPAYIEVDVVGTINQDGSRARLDLPLLNIMRRFQQTRFHRGINIKYLEADASAAGFKNYAVTLHVRHYLYTEGNVRRFDIEREIVFPVRHDVFRNAQMELQDTRIGLITRIDLNEFTNEFALNPDTDPRIDLADFNASTVGIEMWFDIRPKDWDDGQTHPESRFSVEVEEGAEFLFDQLDNVPQIGDASNYNAPVPILLYGKSGTKPTGLVFDPEDAASVENPADALRLKTDTSQGFDTNEFSSTQKNGFNFLFFATGKARVTRDNNGNKVLPDAGFSDGIRIEPDRAVIPWYASIPRTHANLRLQFQNEALSGGSGTSGSGPKVSDLDYKKPSGNFGARVLVDLYWEVNGRSVLRQVINGHDTLVKINGTTPFYRERPALGANHDMWIVLGQEPKNPGDDENPIHMVAFFKSEDAFRGVKGDTGPLTYFIHVYFTDTVHPSSSAGRSINIWEGSKYDANTRVYDDIPETDASNPYLYRARRKVIEGSITDDVPADGDTNVLFSTPEFISRYTVDGTDGDDGDDGADGADALSSRLFFYQVDNRIVQNLTLVGTTGTYITAQANAGNVQVGVTETQRNGETRDTTFFFKPRVPAPAANTDLYAVIVDLPKVPENTTYNVRGLVPYGLIRDHNNLTAEEIDRLLEDHPLSKDRVEGLHDFEESAVTVLDGVESSGADFAQIDEHKRVTKFHNVEKMKELLGVSDDGGGDVVAYSSIYSKVFTPTGLVTTSRSWAGTEMKMYTFDDFEDDFVKVKDNIFTIKKGIADVSLSTSDLRVTETVSVFAGLYNPETNNRLSAPAQNAFVNMNNKVGFSGSRFSDTPVTTYTGSSAQPFFCAVAVFGTNTATILANANTSLAFNNAFYLIPPPTPSTSFRLTPRANALADIPANQASPGLAAVLRTAFNAEMVQLARIYNTLFKEPGGTSILMSVANFSEASTGTNSLEVYARHVNSIFGDAPAFSVSDFTTFGLRSLSGNGSANFSIPSAALTAPTTEVDTVGRVELWAVAKPSGALTETLLNSQGLLLDTYRLDAGFQQSYGWTNRSPQQAGTAPLPAANVRHQQNIGLGAHPSNINEPTISEADHTTNGFGYFFMEFNLADAPSFIRTTVSFGNFQAQDVLADLSSDDPEAFFRVQEVTYNNVKVKRVISNGRIRFGSITKTNYELVYS